MKLLALDCSTEHCSVALLDSDSLWERSEQASRKHTQRLLPLVDELLVEAGVAVTQLDGIAFGRGPGSFTGLRICLGAVQGLAFGADLPVFPVSTLHAQAVMSIEQRSADLPEGALVASTLDARMDEVYWALYQFVGGNCLPSGKERLSSPEQLASEANQHGVSWLVGSGVSYQQRMVKELPNAQWDSSCYPSAAAIAQLASTDCQQGLGVTADQALPVYLRDEVAWQKSG